MQSTCHSPRSVPSAMLNVIVEDRTGELRLLDRGVQIRIMWSSRPGEFHPVGAGQPASLPRSQLKTYLKHGDTLVP